MADEPTTYEGTLRLTVSPDGKAKGVWAVTGSDGYSETITLSEDQATQALLNILPPGAISGLPKKRLSFTKTFAFTLAE